MAISVDKLRENSIESGLLSAEQFASLLEQFPADTDSAGGEKSLPDAIKAAICIPLIPPRIPTTTSKQSPANRNLFFMIETVLT